MKKIIFILALFVSFVANAQYTPPTGYTNINSRYDWLAGVFRALGLPAGGNAAFTTGQAQRAGSVYYDSTGADAGLKVWNGAAWVGVGEVTQSALDDTAAAIRADFPTGSLANTNAGSFYRWLKPDAQEIKTWAAGYGFIIDSTTNTDALTSRIDTTLISTRAWRDKLADSLGALIGAGGGANTALSNLASVAVNTSLISDTDITDDLGSSSISWKDIFANVLKAGDGTISLPSISFKNSTNTGLWYTSASGGAINLSLNGVRLGYWNYAPPGSANGQGNTFLGYNAGTTNWASAGTGGLNNTFIGGESGQNNDLGQQNTFIGSRTGVQNTTGSQNTFVGQGAGNENITNSNNAYFGFHAGLNATGASNTYIGGSAGQAATGSTASSNTGIGEESLKVVSSGSNNTAIGRFTLGALTTSPANTGVGTNALFTMTTGNGGNSTLGFQSGYELTTGSYNFIGGAYVQSPSATGVGLLNIGNVLYGTGLYSTASRSSTPTTLGSIGIGLTTPTARLHLPAGTATASTAPLKLTTGTALTTPEDGAVEYHGSHLYFTIGSTRYQIDQQSAGGLTTSDNNLDITGTTLSTQKTVQTLTDGATITWDMSAGYNSEVTLGGNRTLDITNIQEGDYGTITVFQDGTGGRTLAVPGGTIALNSAIGDSTVLSFYYDGNSYSWRDGSKIILFRAATWANPTSSDNITVYKTDVAITVSKVTAVVVGSSPSVTYQINFASDRSSGSPTTLFSSGQVTTSTTTGDEDTTFADATIPAGSYIWITTSAASGTITEMNVTIKYTND